MKRGEVAKKAAASISPRGCTNLKLRQLTRRVGQHYDRIVGAAGLKTTQYSLLSNVVRFGPVRPGDIADALEMDPSTLTRNLQPMVANGWLEVGPGPDGRSRWVTATPAGQAKRAEAQREWKRAQLTLNRKLGDARVVELHALLDDCLACITGIEEDQDG